MQSKTEKLQQEVKDLQRQEVKLLSNRIEMLGKAFDEYRQTSKEIKNLLEQEVSLLEEENRGLTTRIEFLLQRLRLAQGCSEN